MSLNIVLITVIFFVVMVLVAVFIAQQFAMLQKTQTKKSMTLTDKLAASKIVPLDTGRFQEVALSSDSTEENPNRLVNLDSQQTFDQSPGFGPPESTGVEIPEEFAFDDPNIPPDLLNIENKDLQSLYSEYLTAKSINPFDVEPEFKLGLAYLKNTQYEKAQGLFQKVVEGKPEFPGIFYCLGEAYRCNGQFYEAMQAYKQSWEMGHLPSKSRADKIKKLKEETGKEG